MLVRYWMAKAPVTITAAKSLRKAFDLMHRNRIRRLPVVSGEDRLGGIIALSDLYPYIGPHGLNMAEPPAEALEKLSNIRVAEVMTRNPITCDRNATIEEIGALMRREKIGAVPVLEGERLIGIITESDILGALADITRMGADGRRICFRIPVEDKLNIFYKIVSLCEKNGLEILTLLTHPMADSSHLVMLRVRGEKVPDLIDTLWKNHYEVLAATPK